MNWQFENGFKTKSKLLIIFLAKFVTLKNTVKQLIKKYQL